MKQTLRNFQRSLCLLMAFSLLGQTLQWNTQFLPSAYANAESVQGPREAAEEFRIFQDARTVPLQTLQSLDAFGLLGQMPFGPTKKSKHVSSKNISLHFVKTPSKSATSLSKSYGHLDAHKFIGSANAKGLFTLDSVDSTTELIETLKNEGDSVQGNLPIKSDELYIELRHNGEAVLFLDTPVDQAIFFDGKLVFSGKDSLDTVTKTSWYSVVDIDYFRDALRKGLRVPVYKMPVQMREGQTEQGLKIENGELLVNGDTRVSATLLNEIVHTNNLAFNYAVNLNDASTYDGAIQLIDDIGETLRKSQEKIARTFSNQVKNAASNNLQTVDQTFDKLANSLVKDIKSMAEARLLEFQQGTLEGVDTDGLTDQERKRVAQRTVNMIKQLDSLKGNELRAYLSDIKHSLSIEADSPETLEKQRAARIMMDGAGEKSFTKYLQSTLNSHKLQEYIQEHAKRRSTERTLKGKFSVLISKLSVPRPTGAPNLYKSLTYMAGALSGLNTKQERLWMMREGSLHFIHHPLVKISSIAIPTIISGMVAPEATAEFVYKGAENIASIVTYTASSLVDVLKLQGEAISMTTKGLRPNTFKDAYLTSSNATKWMTANYYLISRLLLGFASYHISVNSLSLIKDLSKDEVLRGHFKKAKNFPAVFKTHRGNGANTLEALRLSANELEISNLRSFLADLKASFIIRQDAELKLDLKMEAEGNAAQKGLSYKTENFTDEENAQVKEVLAKLKESNRLFGSKRDALRSKREQVQRYLSNKLPGGALFLERIEKISKRLKFFKKDKKTKGTAEIKTLGKAFMNFVMSWNSLKTSFVFTGKPYWKYFFLARSFFPWELTSLVFMLQRPNFFDTVNGNGLGSNSIIPTHYNGGLRTISEEASLRTQNLLKRIDLKAIKKWEKSFLKVEEKIQFVAMNEAFKIISPELTNKQTLDILGHNNIRSINSPALKLLTKRQKALFIKALDSISNELSERFLRNHHDQLREKLITDVKGSKEQLRQGIDPIQAKEIELSEMNNELIRDSQEVLKLNKKAIQIYTSLGSEFEHLNNEKRYLQRRYNSIHPNDKPVRSLDTVRREAIIEQIKDIEDDLEKHAKDSKEYIKLQEDMSYLQNELKVDASASKPNSLNEARKGVLLEQIKKIDTQLQQHSRKTKLFVMQAEQIQKRMAALEEKKLVIDRLQFEIIELERKRDNVLPGVLDNNVLTQIDLNDQMDWKMFRDDLISLEETVSVDQELKSNLEKMLKDIVTDDFVDSIKEEVGRSYQEKSASGNSAKHTVFDAVKSPFVALKRIPHLLGHEHRSLKRIIKRAEVAGLIGPKHSQVRRWLTVEDQMKDPSAVARSSRKSFYQTFEKIPQLFFVWAGAAAMMLKANAGLVSGSDLMVPLTNQYPYYGDYLLGAGFVFSVLVSFFANFGYNLQVEKHAKSSGMMAKMLSEEDSKKGFLGLMWKNFRDEDNSFWKNYKFINIDIIIPNIKAVITMYSVAYFMFMGRFPIDVFIMMYIVGFIFPTSALNIKIENAFEATSESIYLKDIPRKLMGHPDIQKYIQGKKAFARGVFQYLFTFFYENLIEATVGNLQNMASTVTLSNGETVSRPRALQRALLGGHPIDVYLYWAIEKVKSTVSFIPGVEGAMSFCETVLFGDAGSTAWSPTLDGKNVPTDYFKSK